MRLGVTGTREGMTDYQIEKVTEFLKDVMPYEIHHGDCLGVDIQVATIADMLNIRTVCHPPILDDLRAFHKSTEFREPADYLVRDKQIAYDTEFLMVIPLHDRWQPSGGTWYTHDCARRMKRPLKIFWPHRKNTDD